MASIREIRERIKSIQDIEKITNAMYLISSSKVKKARARLLATEPYFEKSLVTMADILDNTNEENVSFRAFDKRPETEKKDRKSAYLVITSDKGLCGAYNHNLIKTAEKKILEDENSTLFVMGNIGRIYFKRLAKKDDRVNFEDAFNMICDNPRLYSARDVSEELTDRFYSGEFDDVYVIYTDMKSSVDMEPKVMRLLPLSRDNFEQPAEERKSFIYARFEPTPEKVMDRLVPIFLKGVIYSAMVEAFCAEQQARMAAMDNATTNSKEMLDELSLMYNRARQAAITQEITEVVSGSRAAK